MQDLKKVINQDQDMDIQWYKYYNLILFGGSSNAGQNKNNIIMKEVLN